MNSSTAVSLLSALAHEARLQVFRTLVQQGETTAGDLAQELGVPPSTLSFHLKDLRIAGLINSRRDGRRILYTAEVEALAALMEFLGQETSGARDGKEQRPLRVLFLCTGNSARSILAEAILNQDGQGRFQAISAGSHPRGEVDPQALALLRNHGYPVEDARSKSWDEFNRPGAEPLDVVITVCDSAAQELCPSWPGQPLVAHWSIPDPVGLNDNGEMFSEVFRTLLSRISILTHLPPASLNRLGLRASLEPWMS